MGRGSWAVVVVLAFVVAACSSKTATSDGAARMICGLRPMLDAAGTDPDAGDAQALDSGPPLPVCAIASHAGYADGGTNDDCTDALDVAGMRLDPERFTLSADGCVVTDGGAPEGPMGGVVLDGDYDLVRFRSNIFGGERSRRTLRVFDGGAYFEWAIENEDPTVDGGVDAFRFDATMDVAGNTLNVHHVCGPVMPTATYGFSAAGDALTLFNYRNGTGPLDTIYGYQRTCSR